MLKEIYALNSYSTLHNNDSFQQKLLLLFKIYVIIFLFNFLSAPLYLMWEYIVTNLFHYKSLGNQYKLSMHNFFTKYGYWKALLYITLIGPVIEELIFRLPLSFKRKHIAASFGFALVLFAKAIPWISNQNLALNIILRIVLFAVGYLAFAKTLPQHTSPNKRAKTGLILASIIVFGMLHTLNYAPFHLAILFIYPLYVLPQLFMGWILTYVRFKNGFFWGVALHIMINSITMLLQLIYKPF